ncbi:MAG: hypothetical protein H6739_32220 [Alphaproteobacteria bacterium]|nr:hypothetical protein [Alphaproteobacteria bacterium]
MNPLLATLVAIVANLLAGLTALRSTRGEARASALTGAVVTLGAAGFCALPLLIHGESIHMALAGVPLRADALTGTLLLPLGLAVGGLAVALPRQHALPRVMAAASFALAAVELALVADALALLVFAELASGLAVAWGLGAVRRRDAGEGRAAMGYLALSGVLALGALVLAASRGEAFRSLGAVAPVELDLAALLLGAAMLRLGVMPLHTGLVSAMQGRPAGRAALLAVPLGAVVTVIRVVQPAMTSTTWGVALLAVAAAAALLALAAQDLGRSAGWTLAAMHGLLLAGTAEPAPVGAVGGALLWAALILSEVGFVLAIVMVVQRLGAVDLRRLHGLQLAAPRLSLAFLLVVLTLSGAPGTLEFVAEDLLLHGASSRGLVGTALAVITIALVGFNALRLYVRVFYGPSDPSRVDMDARRWEQGVLLALVALLMAGGVAPGLLPIVARAAASAVGG